MSMLSEDMRTGLSFIADIVMHASLDLACVEKVRARILSDVIDFWDTPSQFIGQIAREKIMYNIHIKK